MIGAYKPISGGLANVVEKISLELRKKYKVTVITHEVLNAEKGLGHWKDNEIDIYQERIPYLKRYTSFQVLFQTIKRALLLRKKVDIYHAHGIFYSGIGFIDRKKPLVLTMHGHPSLESVMSGRIKKESIQFKFYRWLEKKTGKRADAIIAVGTELREWVIEEYNVDPTKIFVIPNGVDVTKFYNNKRIRKECRKKLKIDEKKVILYAKSLTEVNGIRFLVNAMPAIIKKHPRTILMIAGDGPLFNEIKKIILQIKCKKNIILLGQVPYGEISDYHNASDLYVLCSLRETFGLSLVEAMSCEKPVIASSIGGPKEILENGKEKTAKDIGLSIPPKDSKAIAKSVIWVLDHPVKSKEMGKRAREFVSNNYTWEKNAEQVLKVYEYAIKQRKKKNQK